MICNCDDNGRNRRNRHNHNEQNDICHPIISALSRCFDIGLSSDSRNISEEDNNNAEFGEAGENVNANGNRIREGEGSDDQNNSRQIHFSAARTVTESASIITDYTSDISRLVRDLGTQDNSLQQLHNETYIRPENDNREQNEEDPEVPDERSDENQINNKVKIGKYNQNVRNVKK